MANKKFWLGILVMVLVFGMTVVGCEEEETSEPNYIEIQNGTTFNITSVVMKNGSTTIVSDNSGIVAGASKKFDNIDASYGAVQVNVTVNGKDVTCGVAAVAGSKGNTLHAKLLLSGEDTDEKPLKLQ